MTTSTEAPENTDSGQENPEPKLMVNGFLYSEDGCTFYSEVQRGMPILSLEGQDMGRVAAVILEGDTGKASHILLSRLPEKQGYWMIPGDLIIEVRDDKLFLSIPEDAVGTLSRWYSNE